MKKTPARRTIAPMDNAVPVTRLSIVSFLSQAAIVMFNFTLVYYLKDLGFSSSSIGTATSICPVVYLLGCLFLPRVLPSVNRKARVAVSLMGMALSILLFPSMRGKAFIYAVLVLYGFFQSLLWTNIETWITSEPRKYSLTKTLTLFNLSWSASVGVSNLLGGIFSSLSYSLSFSVSTSLFITASIIVLTSYYGKNDENAAKEKEDEEKPSPYRYLAWLGIFVIYTGYSMVIVVFPQYGLDELAFSSSVSGRLLFYRGVSVCIAFLLLKRYTLWQKGKGAIIFMLSSFSLLTLLFDIVKTEWALAVVFVLYGFIFALGYDLSIYHSALGGGKRHTRMVIHEVLITAGTTAGSFLGSLVYEFMSFKVLVISVTLLGALSVVPALLRKRSELPTAP